MRSRWLTGVFTFVAGVLALPILLLLLALAGWLPTDAVPQPPGWEVAIAEPALDASLERRAKGLHNPIAVNDNAALLAGVKLFRDDCAGCHGGAHADSKWGAHNFYPRVPQFWRMEADDVPTPEEAFVTARDGIRYSGMAAWSGALSEQQMWQVANFVSRIQHLPPEVNRAWQAKQH